jgi:hypothetical protein
VSKTVHKPPCPDQRIHQAPSFRYQNLSQFGRIQIDRTEEIRKWAGKLKEIRQNVKDVKDAIVAANNHYRGYGLEL